MDTFPPQTQGYYLSLKDAEYLTDRRLPHQLLGASTSSLEVFEEELKGQLVVVKRFRIDEQHRPSLANVSVPCFLFYYSSTNPLQIMAALEKWKQVSSHPNIIPFLGLCSEALKPLPILVTPRACWNILQYIEIHPEASKHALVRNRSRTTL